MQPGRYMFRISFSTQQGYRAEQQRDACHAAKRRHEHRGRRVFLIQRILAADGAGGAHHRRARDEHQKYAQILRHKALRDEIYRQRRGVDALLYQQIRRQARQRYPDKQRRDGCHALAPGVCRATPRNIPPTAVLKTRPAWVISAQSNSCRRPPVQYFYIFSI